MRLICSKTFWLINFCLMLFVVLTTAQAATVTLSCGSVGQGLQQCKKGVEKWQAKTGHKVKLISVPNSTSEQLALYQQLLSARSTEIDLFQIDVVWPGMLAKHLENLSPYVSKEVVEGHFDALINNNIVDGNLLAMPWYTDAGVLYYRRDLLEKYSFKAPQTWSELEEIATKIVAAEKVQGNKNLWGYVFQGKAYEGLTCNALEWIDSYGGGHVIDDSGNITIHNTKAIKAIDNFAGWIGTLSPKGVLNYEEEEARGAFQSGQAIFMRNWPYAWALLQSEDSFVKDKVGVVALPKGGTEGKKTGTLGGWQLAVSKYSMNKDLAVDLLLFLTGEEEQKRRAITGAYNPTIKHLYQDNEILAANPFFGLLYETFVQAVPRPSKLTGKKYNKVSHAFWNAVHSTLSGHNEADKNLKKLEKKLTKMKKRNRW